MDLVREARVTGAAIPHRFTGRVDVAASFGGAAGQYGARMTFHPGARTAWHSHPGGQTLLVIEGEGLLQRDGGRPEPMQAGDVVWVEPGRRRWFGAAPDASIALIALAAADAVSDVVWMERVDERDYRAA
ncbi:MAG TPA: cupin domain-containing protein [Bosea sp. (in: a-proteobacteria)]|jgi:quercetin dioxygenase-like cupin family protein|uniref:cupin domain-containing protein n=1 Tax=Bosea sp. (in: a-proteobacteria) TaxID=1871050 RepID=UPI002E14EC90|nr:cupin domain-containing protein [Bosea sp. (in: a-proteobacteria)]